MDEASQIAQATLQKKWEDEFHHLFMLMRGKFRPGTLITIAARDPAGDPEGDFCWTTESGTEELRRFLDRLDARNRRKEVKPTTQIINVNGFKAK